MFFAYLSPLAKLTKLTNEKQIENDDTMKLLK